MNARHRLRAQTPVSSVSSPVHSPVHSPFDDAPTNPTAPAAAPAVAPVTPWASAAPAGSPVASPVGSALSSLDVFTPTFDELMYGPSAARYAPDTTQRLPAYGGVLGQHPPAPESQYPTPDTDAMEPPRMQSETVPDDDVLDDTFSAAMARTRSARPTTRPEGEITADCLRWINDQPRAFARKVHQAAMSGGGEPDIDACVDGRAVKIEMKRPGETPTGRQLNRLKRWQRAGAVVGWATSLDEVRALVGRVPDVRWRNPLTGPGAPDA